MSRSAIEIIGDRLSVHFDCFDVESYRLFLQCKTLLEYEVEYIEPTETYWLTAPARFASMLGVDDEGRRHASELPLLDALIDDQAAIVPMALAAKRFACWSDCGSGKTLIGLEFARHVVHRTDQRVLIFTLNEVVGQWLEEAKRFYGDSLPVRRINSRQEMRDWCAGKLDCDCMIAATNYEKMNPDESGQVVNELRLLGGVIADESHRLRTGGGKQKWAIIKSTKGIEYKLSLTATPAPNDTMEFASQASFLETMRNEHDIIWTYFRRDSKTQKWTVKPHARDAFFRFMASWSIYVRDPRRYGWRLNYEPVPEPEIIESRIEATPEQIVAATNYLAESGGVQRSLAVDRDLNAIERVKLSEIAKGFQYFGTGKSRKIEWIPSHKPAAVADIVAKEDAAGVQSLTWTTFDAESDILAGELEKRGIKFASLTGKTPRKRREKIIDDFRSGKIRHLTSLASMLGHGMNFQFVDAMIFSGWNDSYVAWYQAIRRAYRFGKNTKLRVYVPYIEELEIDTLENVLDKEARQVQEIEEMERHYIEALKHLRGVAA